jgi:hypothetical protein
MDFAALKVELQTDPASLGYAVLLAAGNDAALAGLLNAPRPVTIPAGPVESYLVVAAIKRAEFDALTAPDRTYLSFIITPALVNLGVGEVRTALAVLFPPGSATRTNLVALASRPANRVQEIGLGESATVADVLAARKA